MASGVEIMLKALGIDPVEIMGHVQHMLKGVTDQLNNLNNRLSSIDARLERIEDEMEIDRPVNGHVVELLPPEKSRR